MRMERLSSSRVSPLGSLPPNKIMTAPTHPPQNGSHGLIAFLQDQTPDKYEQAKRLLYGTRSFQIETITKTLLFNRS